MRNGDKWMNFDLNTGIEFMMHGTFTAQIGRAHV